MEVRLQKQRNHLVIPIPQKYVEQLRLEAVKLEEGNKVNILVMGAPNKPRIVVTPYWGCITEDPPDP